jgi:hypothetical protein
MKTIASFRLRIARGISNAAASATCDISVETETDERLQDQIKT